MIFGKPTTMEIYLRFLLLFVCIVVHQSDGMEETQYNKMKELIEALMEGQRIKILEQVDNKIKEYDHVGGTTFVRWGRQECPSNISVPVYIGTVGGSHYNHPGGAIEYVCLPPDPQWNTNKNFNGRAWGYMYGAEYHQIPDSSVYDLEVPCSVCLSTAYATTIMIPGRSQCYPGWQEAYHGELSSGNSNHVAASEYVCLDDKHKGIGKKTNLDGKLFFPVRAKCGSLPCPPFEDNKLLTCVVCLGGKRDVQ